MRIDTASLLGHLHAIRDAPDDGRDFFAFERRPQMIAAGISAEHFDRSDFGSKPLVDGMIRQLRGGPVSAPPKVEPQTADANPADFVANADRLQPLNKAFEDMGTQLADGFMRNNMIHLNEGGAAAAPDPALADALRGFARTRVGRDFMQYAVRNGAKQTFRFDPSLRGPAKADRHTGIIRYANLADLEPWRRANASRAVPEDGLETASPISIIAHETGHTPLGRSMYGLPEIRHPETPGVFTQWSGAPLEEEYRATDYYENPTREDEGLPQRNSYDKYLDVERWRRK